MKKACFVIFFIALNFLRIQAQDTEKYSLIDRMLINGDYEKAADTCRLILAGDSANAHIWYKLGVAGQNIMPDTASFNCFIKALEYAPDNRLYKFTVAKGYIIKNRNNKAKPLLAALCMTDSTNWQYAHYLTGIYIQEGRYNEAIDIYNRFHDRDTGNYVFLDKLGFAYLKKSDYHTAIDYYNRSLSINPKNIDAIRNLSFLYPNVNDRDTAIILLTRGINMDPEDIDLYARRATIYFSKNYTKRALNDYLKVMSLGDSSFIYLKRAGIGYLNNLQPKLALPFLFKAYSKDTTDFETLDFIGQCYSRLREYDKSALYYRKVIKALEAFQLPLGTAYMILGQDLKADSLYNEAIESYASSYEVLKDPALLMMIANIYDENLGNSQKALGYYRQFMSAVSKNNLYSPDYVESIKKRMEYLENKIAEEKAKKEYERKNPGIRK